MTRIHHGSFQGKRHGKIVRKQLVGIGSAFAALVMLAACSTTSGSYCAINRPLVYSDAVIDQMSDAEVERTLAELEKYRRLCRK